MEAGGNGGGPVADLAVSPLCPDAGVVVLVYEELGGSSHPGPGGALVVVGGHGPAGGAVEVLETPTRRKRRTVARDLGDLDGEGTGGGRTGAAYVSTDDVALVGGGNVHVLPSVGPADGGDASAARGGHPECVHVAGPTQGEGGGIEGISLDISGGDGGTELGDGKIQYKGLEVQPELTDIGVTLADCHLAVGALGDARGGEVGVVLCQGGTATGHLENATDTERTGTGSTGASPLGGALGLRVASPVTTRGGGGAD